MPRGGSRTGAGRPKGSKTRGVTALSKKPLPYLLEVMRNEEIDMELRVRAAIAAAPYVHPKA